MLYPNPFNTFFIILSMDFDSDFDVEISDFGVNQRTYGLRCDHEYGGTIACMPRFDGKLVFFGCDNKIFYALDAETVK